MTPYLFLSYYDILFSLITSPRPPRPPVSQALVKRQESSQFEPYFPFSYIPFSPYPTPTWPPRKTKKKRKESSLPLPEPYFSLFLSYSKVYTFFLFPFSPYIRESPNLCFYYFTPLLSPLAPYYRKSILPSSSPRNPSQPPRASPTYMYSSQYTSPDLTLPYFTLFYLTLPSRRLTLPTSNPPNPPSLHPFPPNSHLALPSLVLSHPAKQAKKSPNTLVLGSFCRIHIPKTVLLLLLLNV